MICGDVGQETWEKVVVVRPPKPHVQNFGWRTFEAFQCQLRYAKQSECDAI